MRPACPMERKARARPDHLSALRDGLRGQAGWAREHSLPTGQGGEAAARQGELGAGTASSSVEYRGWALVGRPRGGRLSARSPLCWISTYAAHCSGRNGGGPTSSPPVHAVPSVIRTGEAACLDWGEIALAGGSSQCRVTPCPTHPRRTFGSPPDSFGWAYATPSGPGWRFGTGLCRNGPDREPHRGRTHFHRPTR